MKVVCIADTQGYAHQVLPDMLPDGDMLVIAGDLTGNGSLTELGAFDNWLGTLPYKHKIIVGGNHDDRLRNINGHTFFQNGRYVQDELIEVEGLKIYGSPMSEMGHYYEAKWAFCNPDYNLKAAMAIPAGLDLLITHGPPRGILDYISTDGRVGSYPLLLAVEDKKPRFHVFGHIHESFGSRAVNGTTFINAALCDGRNRLFDREGKLLHPPQVIEL